MTLPAAAVAAPTTGLADNLDRPPADPNTWTLEDAQKVVGAQTPAWASEARLFVVDGDHWQRATGWIGPAPLPSESGYQETLTIIERGFTTRNALKEVTKRYTNGCVGHEPAWRLVPKRAMKTGEEPSADEQTLIDEAQAALTVWWDRFGIPSLFWQAVYQMTWGQRGPLRLYLSADAFQTAARANGNGASAAVRQSTLDDALRMILLDVPKLESAAVYTDPDTKREIGVYLFSDRAGTEKAEIAFLDREGRAVLRTVGGDRETRARPGVTTTPAVPGIVAELAGYLPHYQLVRPTRILTEAAFDLQRALNFAMTVIPRTLATAGFLERWLLNMKVGGAWIEKDGVKVWQPSPNLEFGPGTTNVGYGEKVDDGQGKETVVPADVKWREPSDVEGPVRAADGIYAKLLEECDQAHVLLASEAMPSGRSRREARADYEASLEEGKLPIESAGRWLIGAALALAEYLIGAPGKYTKTLRPQFTVRLNAGPAEPEDRAQTLAEWEKGARSIESVMLGAGITDPDGEQAQISQEPGARLEIARRQGETMAQWLELGADEELAAEVAGVDKKIAQRLAKARKEREEAARKAALDADNAGGDNGGTQNGNPAGSNAGGGQSEE